MSVITARTAGFCWGVRRAVDLVLAELKKGSVPYAVFGELVHNPQVLRALEERGVTVCRDPGAMGSGTLFLRTHGVTLEEREQLSALSLELRDLTCPRVGRALSLSKSRSADGRDVLILGDAGHQEVKAILSYGGPGARVISGPEDVPGLPDLERPFLISQTTQDTDVWKLTMDALRERFPNLEEACTICDSTSLRQMELRELCPKVDCVVVVGGRNSANTARLAAIAAGEGLPVFQVETPEELDQDVLSGFERVLLTAGASTPSWSIRRVRERLLEIQGGSLRAGPVRRFLRSLVFGNFHIIPVAFAAGAAGGFLFGGGDWFPSVLAASLFLYAVSSVTSILESGYSRPYGLRRQEFLRKYRTILTISSFTAFGGSLLLSLNLDPIWPSVLGIMLLAFLVYSMPLIRGRNLFGGLRAIPGSRDVMFAGAWSLLLAFLPGLGAFEGKVASGPVLWTGTLFFLFLARCLLADLTDLQGDALMGIDTIPIHAGRDRSVRLFWACIVLTAVLPAVGMAAGFLPPQASAFAIGLGFLCVGYFVLRSASFPSELFKRAVADGSLFIAGAAPALLCWAGGC